jgi:hypothetical protein
MVATKGAAPDSVQTEIEGRKIVDTWKRDRRSSKSSPQNIQAAHRNDPVRCPICDRTVERKSRQQNYCSTRCRKRAWLEKPAGALKKSARYPYSGHRDAPQNSASQINALQQTKTGSSLFYNGIIGPRAVIQAEVIAGHEWQEVISTGGVRSHQTIIRRPALVRGRG